MHACGRAGRRSNAAQRGPEGGAGADRSRSCSLHQQHQHQHSTISTTTLQLWGQAAWLGGPEHAMAHVEPPAHVEPARPQAASRALLASTDAPAAVLGAVSRGFHSSVGAQAAAKDLDASTARPP